MAFEDTNCDGVDGDYLGGPGTAGTSVGAATGGLRGRDTASGNGGTGGAGGIGGNGAGGGGSVGNYGSFVFSDLWPTAHSVDGGFGGNGCFGGKSGGGGAGADGPAVGLLQASGDSSYAAQRGTTETAGDAGTGGKQGNSGLVAAGGQSAGILRSTMAPSTSKADFDADGFADPVDVCPGVAAPTSADGCLKRPAKLTDRDGDGVPDTVDACPRRRRRSDGPRPGRLP